jgi:beta-ribofuranosylaminobenzene 5'-phosphate synthase
MPPSNFCASIYNKSRTRRAEPFPSMIARMPDASRITVCTPSRLHFGLFALPSDAPAPGMPVRQFGGVGLMVEQPGIQLEAACSETWLAEGPGADRALAFAKRYTAAVGSERRFRVALRSCSPEHAGLGTGTQLGLAVATALSRLLGQPNDAATLAPRVERGLRSALGVHGFAQGGFLIEGGKREGIALSPLLCRHPFPDDWRVLLVLPDDVRGTHGAEEKQAFAKLRELPADPARTDVLCRLALLGMLPALFEGDLDTFGEAIHEFNRLVGERFRPWQHGVYAHPRVEALVAWLRHAGVRGVGQSSWGPAVFAIVAADQAEAVRASLLRAGMCRAEEVMVTAAANGGARIATE